jgi:L-rhamnose-H+ transport protein
MNLAIIFVIIGGLSHATFGLGQKRFEPLSWEAFWLPFAFVSMIIIPLIWASTMGTEIWTVFFSLPLSTILLTAFFGACWGLAAIFWGKALVWIGMSLVYGIVLSITMATGSLVPMLRIKGVVNSPAFPFILLGTAVMLVGVYVITLAGIKRDKLQTADKKIKGVVSGRLFRLGLILCILSGLLGALQNIGYSEAQTKALSMGASNSNANLVSWLIVFIGGFLIQGGYTLYLLLKNKSYTTYKIKPVWKPWLKIIITSLFWFMALAFYGQGSAMMGKLGTSVGWTMFLSLSLIISNLYAYFLGEWHDMKKPLKIMLAGNAILLVSWMILGYANSLNN